jgi:cytochrome P450
LALNPDIQEKLQAEIDKYFEDKPVSFTWPYSLLPNKWSKIPGLFYCKDSSLYEATQNITYLDNVVQESIRIYPPGGAR